MLFAVRLLVSPLGQFPQISDTIIVVLPMPTAARDAIQHSALAVLLVDHPREARPAQARGLQQMVAADLPMAAPLAEMEHAVPNSGGAAAQMRTVEPVVRAASDRASKSLQINFKPVSNWDPRLWILVYCIGELVYNGMMMYCELSRGLVHFISYIAQIIE